MERTILLHSFGTDTVREISVKEAEEILEETYSNRVGGLVLDAKTGQVIWQIGPDIREIVVVTMVGGG